MSLSTSSTPRVTVLLLFRSDEIEVTAKTLAYLEAQDCANLWVSLLHNGPPRPDLQARFKRPWIFYRDAGQDLGVAGGRNLLLRTREAQSSDILSFLDNDVVLPAGYLETSIRFLSDRPDAGIVGAVSLDYGRFKDLLQASPTRGSGFGHTVHHFTSQDLRDWMPEDPDPGWFDHLGTHRAWDAVYVRMDHIRDQIAQFQGAEEGGFAGVLKERPEIRSAVQAGTLEELEVSNIAGCCQMFRRQLVDEIGTLDEGFNPYGFEDVDFSVRTMSHGFRNFINCQNFLLHGTDHRHQERRTSERVLRHQQNEVRCFTVLARRHCPSDYPRIVGEQILLRYLRNRVLNHPADTPLAYHLRGYAEGLSVTESDLHRRTVKLADIVPKNVHEGPDAVVASLYESVGSKLLEAASGSHPTDRAEPNGAQKELFAELGRVYEALTSTGPATTGDSETAPPRRKAPFRRAAVLRLRALLGTVGASRHHWIWPIVGLVVTGALAVLFFGPLPSILAILAVVYANVAFVQLRGAIQRGRLRNELLERLAADFQEERTVRRTLVEQEAVANAALSETLRLEVDHRLANAQQSLERSLNRGAESLEEWREQLRKERSERGTELKREREELLAAVEGERAATAASLEELRSSIECDLLRSRRAMEAAIEDAIRGHEVRWQEELRLVRKELLTHIEGERAANAASHEELRSSIERDLTRSERRMETAIREALRDHAERWQEGLKREREERLATVEQERTRTAARLDALRRSSEDLEARAKRALENSIRALRDREASEQACSSSLEALEVETREAIARLDSRDEEIGRSVEEERNERRRALAAERSERILSFARRDSIDPAPTRCLLLITVERTGSTWLLDALRCHPGIRLEPAAVLYGHLGLDGGRYPAGLSERADGVVDFEISLGRGARIPSFGAIDPVSQWITDNGGPYSIEKIHPSFFRFDANGFLQRVRSYERTHGASIRFVYQVREPRAAIVSFLTYQRRDTRWKSGIGADEVFVYKEKMYRAVLETARKRKGPVIDYQDLVESFVPTLADLYQHFWPDSSRKEALTIARRAEKATAREARRRSNGSPSQFFGDQEDAKAAPAEALFEAHQDLVLTCERHYRDLLALKSPHP